MRRSFIILLLITVAVIYTACRETIREIPVEIEAMRASTLYNTDSVSAFLARSTQKHKDIATNYLKRSKDIEKEDIQKSIYFQKRSLSLNPDQEGYRRLGSLLRLSRQSEEAAMLYSFLLQKTYTKNDTGTYVFGNPSADDFYHYIASYIEKDKYVDPYMIYDAKENGIDIQYIRRKLEKDEQLSIDKQSDLFRNILVNFWTDAEIENYRQSPEAFRNFLASANDTLKNFNITADNVADFNYKDERSFEMEAMAMSDFNHYFLEEAQQDKDFYALHNLEHSFPVGNRMVMVYALDSSNRGCIKDLRNITHKLVIYDEKGRPLDSRIIGRQSPERLITAHVNFPEIELRYFERKWKNLVTPDQLENELIAVEFFKTEYYTIANGKFELNEEF